MYKVKESEKTIILKKNIKELKIVKRGIEDLASKKNIYEGSKILLNK